MKEILFKRCKNCSSLVRVIEDCNCKGCGIICCEEPMEIIKSNSTDASFEKHVPVYEIEDGNVIVKVNHVMEEDHYIMFITAFYGNREETIYFSPNDECKATFKYEKGMKLYSYCNKHSLWEKEVL